MVELKGVVDIRIAAKLLCTDFIPYAIKKNGATKLINLTKGKVKEIAE